MYKVINRMPSNGIDVSSIRAQADEADPTAGGFAQNVESLMGTLLRQAVLRLEEGWYYCLDTVTVEEHTTYGDKRLVLYPFIEVVSVKDADDNDVEYTVNQDSYGRATIYLTSYDECTITYKAGAQESVPSSIEIAIFNDVYKRFTTKSYDSDALADAMYNTVYQWL